MSTNLENRRRYFRDRYKARRISLINKLGGKCIICGGIDNLELDHKDPKEKLYEFSQLFMLRESGIWFKKEVEKLQLLCQNCHTSKSAKELSIKCPHGNSTKRYCKLCKRDWARIYKSNRLSLQKVLGTRNSIG